MSARQNYSSSKFARISVFNTSGRCLRFRRMKQEYSTATGDNN